MPSEQQSRFKKTVRGLVVMVVMVCTLFVAAIQPHGNTASSTWQHI
jgi:hypothetical protein